MRRRGSINFRRPMKVKRMRLVRQKGRWTKAGEREVDAMMLPAPHWPPRLPPGVLAGGAWYEVLARDGELLYRRRFSQPDSIEVFDEEGEPFRQDLPLEQG